MPETIQNKFVHSFSAIDSFNNCPRRFHYKYILKIKEPQTEQQKHGDLVHRALDVSLSNNIVTEIAKPYAPLVRSIQEKAKGSTIFTELKMGITYELEPAQFFGSDVYVRGIADIAIVGDVSAFIGDWKTGKRREKELQVKIFSLMLMAKFPELNRVTGCNIWLQDMKPGLPYIFEKKDYESHWNDVFQETKKIEEAIALGNFPERPSGLCGWCPVKGCQHWRERWRER